MTALVLGTLVVYRQTQSESIEVALDIKIRRFHKPFDTDWQVSLLLVKLRITCLRVTLREQLNLLYHDFVGWAAHQTVFSVVCNSNSETRSCDIPLSPWKYVQGDVGRVVIPERCSESTR